MTCPSFYGSKTVWTWPKQFVTVQNNLDGPNSFWTYRKGQGRHYTVPEKIHSIFSNIICCVHLFTKSVNATQKKEVYKTSLLLGNMYIHFFLYSVFHASFNKIVNTAQRNTLYKNRFYHIFLNQFFFPILEFFQKNEWNNSIIVLLGKQTNSFVRLFGRIVGLKKTLRLCLTFSTVNTGVFFFILWSRLVYFRQYQFQCLRSKQDF